jgi:hypothetical protein
VIILLRSVIANGDAAHGTVTNDGIPYITDSNAAILLKATVANIPSSRASNIEW